MSIEKEDEEKKKKKLFLMPEERGRGGPVCIESGVQGEPRPVAGHLHEKKEKKKECFANLFSLREGGKTSPMREFESKLDRREGHKTYP